MNIEELDVEKIELLKQKIFEIEKENLSRAKPKKDTEVVDELKRLIEQEVKKCY